MLLKKTDRPLVLMLLGYAMLPWLTDIASNLAWSVEPCRSFHVIGRLQSLDFLHVDPLQHVVAPVQPDPPH